MRRVLAGAAALALSGCWLQTGYGPTHQSSNPFETGLTAGKVASLAPVWSTPVPNEFGAEPLVDGSSVYTAGFEGVDTFAVTALGRGWAPPCGTTTCRPSRVSPVPPSAPWCARVPTRSSSPAPARRAAR